MRQARRGLTIVELTVGILCIVLIAMLAWPHVESHQRGQRIARLNAAHDAARQAMVALHGEALSRRGAAQPTCVQPGFGANPPLVSTTGHGNICTVRGRVQIAGLYPAPTLAGIVAGAGLASEPGTPDAGRLARSGYVVAELTGGLRVQVPGGPDATRCAFVYSPPEAAGAAASIGDAETAGC